MPELPEVEHAARRLREVVVGHTIVTARALHPATARSLTASTCRKLVGRVILSVERRAKVQLVGLDDGCLLAVHLRMTGDWDLGLATDPAPAYERARLTLANGRRVSFVDSRALGVLTLHAPGTFPRASFGPEPLDVSFTADVLAKALSTRRGPIKTVLLEQRVVAGLGNIYAVEALWVARISPVAIASRLSRTRIERLRDAIVQVLRDATGARYYDRDEHALGTTKATPSHVEPWRVYDRAGQACARCGGLVSRIVQGGRGTFFCRRCQR